MKKKFTKLFSLTLIFTLLFSSFVSAGDINIYLKDKPLTLSTKPIKENNHTLVPMRSIFESLGAKIEWDEDTQTVTAIKDDIIIKLTIGNETAYVNNIPQKLEIAPKKINGNTLVPVRFVSETLGLETGWDNNTYSVLLDSKAPFNSYKVNRVVDGDTIKINFNGKEESLRLIGVDTPESVHSDSSKNTKEGKIASDYTRKMLEGKTVGIEFDVQERDQYGRLLGYVYINGKMFNKTLLEEGYAKLATYPPNTKYVDEFIKLQTKAREQQKGFWKEEVKTNQSTNNAKKTTPKQETSTPATSGAYIGSIKSDKFHKPSCRHAKKIASYNEIWFKNNQDAYNNGYVPCKVCKP